MKLDKRTKKLFDFVKSQHGDQVRKYTGEPYWQHLWKVAETVSIVTKENSVIIVALCHDLFEDTNCTAQILADKMRDLAYSSTTIDFVVIGVNHLTDHFTPENCPNSNRKERKQNEAKRLWAIPDWAQTIKYADLLDNTSSILKHDENFAKVYLEEKRYILLNMRSGNQELLNQLELTIN